jgi:hypothetical protein
MLLSQLQLHIFRLLYTGHGDTTVFRNVGKYLLVKGAEHSVRFDSSFRQPIGYSFNYIRSANFFIEPVRQLHT